MTSTLLDSRVAATLERMFTEADAQLPKLGELMGNDAVPAESSAQERADALDEFYLPVTADAGRLLYALVRASRPDDRGGVRHVLGHLRDPPRVGGPRQRSGPGGDHGAQRQQGRRRRAATSPTPGSTT